MTIDRQIEALEKEVYALRERMVKVGSGIDTLDAAGYVLPHRLRKEQLLNGAFSSLCEAEEALNRAKWID